MVYSTYLFQFPNAIIKGRRGFKRDYSVIDEAAVAKMKRLMEKHLDDPNEYGLYRMMTATTFDPLSQPCLNYHQCKIWSGV